MTEITVIVVGVLVALAVDDWRQTLEERRIERGAYVQLLEDLRLDSVDLAVARARAGNRARAGLLLLERRSLPESELSGFRVQLRDALAFSDPSLLAEGPTASALS